MTEWPRPRSGERWTIAEEQRLLRLFAKPKRVWWCGRLRTTPMYYVASVLGRSPSACAEKFYELRRCQKRAQLSQCQTAPAQPA